MNFSTKIVGFIGRKFGYYTDKEAFRIAEKIGKDLVDFEKLGGFNTKETIQKIAKKHAPNVKYDLSTTREELTNTLRKLGVPQEAIKRTAEHDAYAFYYKYKSNPGIFNPIDDTLPLTFPHEFVHLLHDKTLWSKIISSKNAFANTSKILKLIDSLGELSSFQGFKYITGSGNMDNIPIQWIMEDFKGIDSAKRLRAYLTALVRSYVHPKTKGATKRLLAIRDGIKDEQRAYTISDRIHKYIANVSQSTTTFNSCIVNLLKELDDVLKQEIKIAMTTRTTRIKPNGKPSELVEKNPLELKMKHLFD